MPAFTSERRHISDRRSGRDRRERAIIDPAAEEAYWRANFKREIYYEKGLTFEDYHPAYRTGWEGRARHRGRSFEEVERELQADYNRNRAGSRLAWDRSKHAVRAGWERFDAADPFERSQ
jgi:hypothetical protein